MPEAGAEGVIIAQGGVSGGLSPSTATAFFGLERHYVQGTQPIPSGTHQVRLEFAYDGGGLGKGGTATIYLDGDAVGESRIAQSEALYFSADETFDLGNEFGSPVTTDYNQRKLNGKVNWVELDVGLDDHNHPIRPEDRLNLAMAFQ